MKPLNEIPFSKVNQFTHNLFETLELGPWDGEISMDKDKASFYQVRLEGKPFAEHICVLMRKNELVVAYHIEYGDPAKNELVEEALKQKFQEFGFKQNERTSTWVWYEKCGQWSDFAFEVDAIAWALTELSAAYKAFTNK